MPNFIDHLPKASTIMLLAGLVSACDAQTDADYSGEPLAELRGTVIQEPGGPTVQAPEVAVLWHQANPGSACEGPLMECGVGGFTGPDEAMVCFYQCHQTLESTFITEVYGRCQPEDNAAFVECVSNCGGWFKDDSRLAVCNHSLVGEFAEVDGEFPSEFQLKLYDPPEDSTLMRSRDGLRVAIGMLAVTDASFTTELHDPWWLTPGIAGGSESHILIYAADSIPADSTWGQLLGGSYDPGYHIVGVENVKEFFTGPDGSHGHTTKAYFSPSPDGMNTSLSLRLAPSDTLAWPRI